VVWNKFKEDRTKGKCNFSLHLCGDGNAPPIETARVRAILAAYLATTVCSVPLLHVIRTLSGGIILVIDHHNAQILVL